MNLLVVMRYFPWPPRTGSTLVAYHSIKELAKRHSVSMVCRERPADPGDLVDALKEVHYADADAEQTPAAVTKLAALARGTPALIYNCASRSMQRAVAERASGVDALVVFEMHAIQYCPASAHGIVVANIEDPPSIKSGLYSKLRVYPRWQRARLLVEGRLLSRYEKRVLPRLARVLLLSRADVALMRERGGHLNLGHVSYGTTPRSERDIAAWDDRADGAIVFSGTMSHGPNIDAALWLLRNVFPIVLRDVPSAVLSIVGASPDARIVAAARDLPGRVIVTGEVPDMSEHIARARVSVCPVRVAIGVQTKVLEAFAVGTPVVTTSAGNSGIGAVSGKHLWVADDAAQFARRVVELLRGDGWSGMSEGGRRLAAELTWQRSADALERYLAEAMSGSRRAS
jgi:glycosyltransferase involved in cell wall biosynthesis